jgi:hypothetical protein
MRFAILPGLPVYGPMALSFTKNGAREHREGLVVRFYPGSSEPWVGNFLGGLTSYNKVLNHPNETDVIVVARGEGHIVDLERRAVRHRSGGDIEDVIPHQILKAFSTTVGDGFAYNPPLKLRTSPQTTRRMDRALAKPIAAFGVA